jgi:hypothetical protein
MDVRAAFFVASTLLCPVQLACRLSSTSVTATGCSTASTVGVTGCFIRRAAFFAAVRLGLALATIRFVAFAALDTLRAFPRLFLLGSFPRFCAFARFLLLAMIRPSPGWWSATHDVGSESPGNLSNELSTDRSLSAATQALFFLGRNGASPFERKAWDEGERQPHLVHRPVRQPNGRCPRTRHVGGRRQSR